MSDDKDGECESLFRLDLSSLEGLALSDGALAALREHISSKSDEQCVGEEKISSAGSGNHGNHVFKEKSYWEDRFEMEETYDWLVTFHQSKQYVLPFLKPDFRILILGCGNSTFSADLYDAGFVNIINIDFARNVIDKMILEHQEKRPLMQWVCMDFLDMSELATHSFDTCIDKAGSDALFCNEGDPWYPEKEVIDKVDKMCLEISRVLKPGGQFLHISFAQPHFRTKYLKGLQAEGICDSVSPYSSVDGFSTRYSWNLRSSTPIEVESGCLNSFMYVMDKE